MPISKPNHSIRICTNFKDLNRDFPKDDFPLPKIDIIIDLIVGNEILSLMDGFSSYNNIKIAPKDKIKLLSHSHGVLSFGT